MKERIISAAIIAIGLIVGGFLIGGRYEIVPGPSNAVARLDRLTGKVEMCVIGAGQDSCGLVIRRLADASAPPCADGSSDCEPWEREWDGAPPLQEGSVVARDGTITPPTGE